MGGINPPPPSGTALSRDLGRWDRAAFSPCVSLILVVTRADGLGWDCSRRLALQEQKRIPCAGMTERKAKAEANPSLR